MEVEIKRAELKNLKEVQNLNHGLFQKEYNEYDKLLDLDWTFGELGTRYYKNRISGKDSCVLIAIVNNIVVGYLCGKLISGEEYRKLLLMAELENMSVIKDFRSKGIGKKLFDNFVDWCKTKKVKKIKVEASAQNKLGINFYKREGFKEYSLILENNI